MTIPTHITRLAKTFALALAAAAFAVPTALAGNGLVDDWFRAPKVAPQTSIGLIDVSFKESSKPVATTVARPTGGRLVDDWFRDAKAAPQTSMGLIDVSFKETSRPVASTTVAAPPIESAPAQSGFHWSDFGIGAGAMLGLALLLAGISLGALSRRHRSGTLRTS
jgi:hypothetical protein